ncbi:MAG: CoA transferase [Nitriliruptoraceae bacterium]
MATRGSPRSTSEPAGAGPLAGHVVLELGSTVAGPFCGRLLADFGAEVIKVEPATGDAVRSMGMHRRGRSLYAASILRNKHLISLDLRTEEGRDVVLRMIPHVDIVVENFRPGTMERWGLDHAALSEINPGLVMVRISGYGQEGPYSARAGYGVVSEAVSGLRELTGDPDRPPPRVAVSLTDYISGLYAAFGAVMAINHRTVTGRGQVVDTALYEAAFSFTEPYVPAFSELGVVATRTGSRLINNAPNTLFEAADGDVVIAAGTQTVFRRLCAAMKRPDLLDDPRFATPAARNTHTNEIEAIVANWARSHTVEQLEEMLNAHDVPASRIFDMADIFTDPQYRTRGMLVEVDDPDAQPDGNVNGPPATVTLAGIVPRLSNTPGEVRWAGRAIGADTRSVLRRHAGLDDATIDHLHDIGAAWCAPPADTATESSSDSDLGDSETRR